MNVELFPGGLTGARRRARPQSELPGAPTESTSGSANRRVLLRAAGAEGEVVDELLRYDGPLLEADANTGGPPPDASEGARWEAWTALAERAALVGLVPALCHRCPQLLFPIRAGIGSTDAYRLMTRRGIWPVGMPGATGLELRRPTEIALTLHSSFMGRIPLMVVPDRADFVSLVRAFTARNEPVPVPASMGACLVAGFNQWEDRFILLGTGPYGDVSAEAAGHDEATWRALSMSIRREHECTHDYTWRVAGRARRHALDETIADFVGLVRTFGTFREDLALQFLGLERFPEYRAGARLERCLGSPPLSDEAFRVLRCLVHAAVLNLARLDADGLGPGGEEEPLLRLVNGLCRMALSELAAPDFALRLRPRLTG